MKKLTINEIAEMVGVSKTTISFYLNGKTNKMSDETQKKIQQVIEETGYTPSAATRTVKASDDCIGVILGDVSKPFAADRKSTRLNSSHITRSRMPSSA